jgi:Flp pilus assembly pilin Flp
LAGRMRGEGARVSIREERREGFTICPFLNSVVGLHQDEAGQGLIEYVLVLGLIGLSAVAAMKVLASNISSAFSKVSSKLTSALS